MTNASTRRILRRSTSLLALGFAFASAAAAAQQAQGAAPCHDANGVASPCPAGSTPAQAGSTDAATAIAPAADGAVAQTADTGEIVVTGSRIRRDPQFAAPNPIVSLGSEQIQNAGLTNLTDFLAQYPALIGSQTSAVTAGGDAVGETGLNLLNLRNLGTSRTLVLVDGRRHVASEPGTAAVDINTIPTDLIERIDILTGGVSAIYGADGVSGVVNFVLKKDFDGLVAHGQAGISQRGDAGERSASITYGKNFAGGRGNIALSYQYGAEDELQSYDRSRLDAARRHVFIPNPSEDSSGVDDPTVPDRIPFTDVRYADTARAGALDFRGDCTDDDGNPTGATNCADFIPDTLGNGSPYDRGHLLPSGYTQGGSSTSIADYGEDLQPRLRRNIVQAIGHFDVSDAFTLFGEAKYASTRSFTLGQPTFDYYLFVEPDNPYLPQNVRSAVADAGGADLTRDNFDLGLRGEDITRHTVRTVIGARGDISPTFHYELSYVFGQTKTKNTLIGDQYSDRFLAALDAVTDPATGKVTCRVNLEGKSWTANQPYLDETSTRHVFTPKTFNPGECIPLNLLGEGVASQAAIDWITTPTTYRTTQTQHVVSGSVSGDFSQLFSLPGGPIGFAGGAEYRWEGDNERPDDLVVQGLTYTPQQNPLKAHFDVKEAFAELEAPILKNVLFFHQLSVGAAIRFSDYSTAGKSTTWNVNGTWAPVRDLTLRGTYSVSVRAPNISELYSSFQTYAFFDDPCLPRNVNSGTSYRPANCATTLNALGVDPAAFDDPRSVNIAGVQGGNPNLKPEKAKTLTAGLVLAPRFLPGLKLSFDWYDIKLTKAINTVQPQSASELCVDAPTVPNNFCSLLTRQQGTGLIVGFNVTPQNVASFHTRGVDMNLAYSLKPDWNYGAFAIQVNGNYLNKLSFVSLPGADPTNDLGVSSTTNFGTPAPHFQATGDITWTLGKLSVDYGLQWWSRTYRSTRLRTATQPDLYAPEYIKYKELWQHDINATVAITGKVEIYGGVNNFTDEKPAFGATSYPVSAIGRYFYTGARIKL